MKKSKTALESIKSFIDNTYNRFGNSVSVTDNKPFNPDNPELGYCFKYHNDESNVTIYKIVCSKIGIERTDFRVLMHEYGHIYLGHLDGIHEELDTMICNVFKNHRGEIIDRINKECGIDFADKLVERVIDDPSLNHSLHNIAMDMEVNSKILSKEDVEEMEMDITSVLPKYEEELLKYKIDNTDDPEVKKALEDQLKKMENTAKIKLIIPGRYYLDENTPFPDNLTYGDYLILIIKRLDQFIKMLVSIKNGGNGDTSNVTSEDVQKALGGGSGQSGQGQDGQQQNGQGQPGDGSGSGSSGEAGMNSLSDLMEEMGMTDKKSDSDKNGNGGKDGEKELKDSPYKGTRGGNGGNGKDPYGEGGTSKKDHRTEERDKADDKRKLGQIQAGGGVGCGNSGGPGATRIVSKDGDEVDMALEEVIMNFKSRVVKVDVKKDLTYLYNRGINRSVLAPSIRRKSTISSDPTIVFLIDISGSMDTRLVDRILKTISKKMKKINRGLKYNIITWSTELGEHIQNIDPRKGVPRISMGGGTRMAGGMKYFKDNYNEDAILILISDFEDYLEEWHQVELTMPGYTMYGFNYGSSRYNQTFKYFKVKNCRSSSGY